MSGTRGPLSHPNARRQNVKPPKLQLPAEGYKGPTPAWPIAGLDPPEWDRWQVLWTLPQAAMWAKLHLELIVARYVRDVLLVESGQSSTAASSNLRAEVRQLEDRLGLNPIAMLRLDWEIASDELSDKREETLKPARRVRAVDSGEAASG